MMDFATMGLRMGFSDALTAQANAADEAIEQANEIIARKNVRIGELRGEVQGLTGQIEALRRELDSTKRRSAKVREDREVQWKDHLAKVREDHRIALAIYAGHTEGANLVANEMLKALDEVAPGNPWSKPTGRSYPDGSPQVGLNEVFEAAFDTAMKREGIPETKFHREVAQPKA